MLFKQSATNRRPLAIMIIRKSMVFSTLIFASLSVISCHKDAKQKVEVRKTSETLGLENTLLTRIPSDAVGFLQWDSSHPAYKKLLASPWSGNQELLKLAFESSSQSATQGLMAALKKVGIDVTDQKSIEVIQNF